MFNIQDVKINEIKIIDRAREEMVNLKSLTFSIERDGLLYPLLLNEELRLIDGERRYTVLKSLNYETAPCRIIPGLTKDSLDLIELVSNNEREAFTWAEDLELKARLHNFWLNNNEKWGYRETANRLGISLGGLSTDLTLAGAIATFPILKKEDSKAKAKDAYKKLQQQAQAIMAVENLPKDERANLERMLNGQQPKEIDFFEEKLSSARAIEILKEAKEKYSDESDEDYVSTEEEEEEFIVQEPTEEEVPDSGLPKYRYEVCKYESLLPKIPAKTIGFCEIDWPYAIDFNNTYGKTSNIKVTEDDWTFEQLEKAADYLLPLLYEKMLDTSWVLCWTGKEYWAWTNEKAEKAGFTTQPFGVWVKPGGSSNSPNTNMISTFETFLLFRKGKATFNTASFAAHQECPPVPASKRVHQWEKPIKLYNTFFSALSKPGSIFFSPFAGSGNSMVTATLHNMIPIGCDIRQKNFFNFYKTLRNYHLEESI